MAEEKETRRRDDDDEDRIIETVFYELDNSMFALALIAGAAIGAIVLYLWIKKPSTISDLIPKQIVEVPTLSVVPDATPVPTEGIEYVDDVNKEAEQEYAERDQSPSFTFGFPSSFGGN